MATRTKTQKSRQGCRRCKIRRIKCDELEPECNNCLRRGFECPGQKSGLRWSTKHEVYSGKSCSPDESSTVTTEAGRTVRTPQSTNKNSTIGPPSTAVQPDELDVVPPLVERNVDGSWDWNDPSWLDDLNDVLQLELDTLEPSPISGTELSICSTSSNGAIKLDHARVPDQSLRSPFLHSPIDLPSTLVEYWFSHICPVWSAFDSPANFNRKIPLETWTTSEPVFYALQAMSAAFLSDSMPNMNDLVPSLITQATTAIQQKLSTLRGAPAASATNITIDLLFAVFAMGTSIHWVDPSQSGEQFLQTARELLDLWQLNLTANDAMAHAYFHQAMTWWTMMNSLGDQKGSHYDGMDRKRLQYEMRLRQALNLEGSPTGCKHGPPKDQLVTYDGGRLHPWCGASSEVVDLFGQCVALCRSSRNRHKQRVKSSLAASTSTLCDIAIARDLQQELITIDFDIMVAMEELRGISLHTGDEKTPISHLVLTAEAYRHASLMQLYLTFEDLDIRWPKNKWAYKDDFLGGHAATEDRTRSQQLLDMALQLVQFIEQIPVDSGSRCIQPPLLILAAAGLRLDSNAQSPRKQILTDALPSKSSIGIPAHPTISRATIEVSKARRALKSRLFALQSTLPPKPIQVALDLVNAIWREYDGTSTASSDGHWLDVMNDTGLKTIFG